MLGFLLSEATASALRWVVLSAGSLLVGVVVFRRVTRGAWADGDTGVVVRHRVGTLARLTAASLLVASVGRLGQQALSFAATPSEAPAVARTLLGTPWGWAWAVQAGVALLFLTWPRVAVGAERSGLLMAAILGAAPAFMGHAFSSESMTVLAVAADVVHLLAAGAWIGTLAVLVLVALPLSDGARAGVLVRAFSPWALGGAATLGATGLFASWLHVQRLPLLWGSVYGQRLLLKLALVAAVAALGALNWRRLTPRLGEPSGARRLAGAARIELAVAAGVLLVTAVLVATPLPNE